MNVLSGPIYLDASAWLKLYLHEDHSEPLNQTLAGRPDVFVSELGLTEVVSALARRSREAGIGMAAAEAARRAMIEAVNLGQFLFSDLTPSVHRQAEELLFRADASHLRAADALHIALALSAGAKAMASYDRRQRAAAAAWGIALYPPDEAVA